MEAPKVLAPPWAGGAAYIHSLQQAPAPAVQPVVASGQMPPMAGAPLAMPMAVPQSLVTAPGDGSPVAGMSPTAVPSPTIYTSPPAVASYAGAMTPPAYGMPAAAPMAPVAQTGNMCKVTVISLDCYEPPADYAIKITYAGNAATTSARRCTSGQQATWNESIEFLEVAGANISFALEDSARPETGDRGSATTAITPGCVELPLTKMGSHEVTAKLKVLIGVAYPTGPISPVLPTTYAAPAAMPTVENVVYVAPAQYAGTVAEVPAAAVEVAQSPQAMTRVVQQPVEVPVSVAPNTVPAVAETSPILQSITVLPQTYSSLALQQPEVVAQQPIVMPPIVQPMNNMCKVTVANLEEHTGNLNAEWIVKIKYAGMEAATSVRKNSGAGQGTVWNESIEFLVNAGNEVGFDVEDFSNAMSGPLGSAVTPLVPGAYELAIASGTGEVKGKLRVAIGIAYPSTAPQVPAAGSLASVPLPSLTSVPAAAAPAATSYMPAAAPPYQSAGYTIAAAPAIPAVPGMYPGALMASPQMMVSQASTGIGD